MSVLSTSKDFFADDSGEEELQNSKKENEKLIRDSIDKEGMRNVLK